MFWKKKVANMTLEEANAALQKEAKIQKKKPAHKRNTDRQLKLIARIKELESKLHTGFQTQKVW